MNEKQIQELLKQAGFNATEFLDARYDVLVELAFEAGKDFGYDYGYDAGFDAGAESGGDFSAV